MAADPRRFPVKLTPAQRKALAEIAPELADRLKSGERSQQTLRFTLAELKVINRKARAAVRQAGTGREGDSLRHVGDLAAQALERSKHVEAIPGSERVYQFKVTLKDSYPPIWRRIQVQDGTLDRLHEHIQTAMGWTNSHLHHFKVGEQFYGDPLLMQENFDEFGYEDSTRTKLSQVLPPTGKRFRFEYEYDFGDSWWHQVLFEGCLRVEPGGRYPVCVEGERACPPEDVGGVWSYPDFVDAIENPEHERHEELREWVGGTFDPEAFDPAAATRAMRRGLPDWRRVL